MKTSSLKGVAGALVGVSALMPAQAIVIQDAHAETIMLVPATADTSTPPASLATANVVVNAGFAVSETGANDVAAARGLFRSTSYPESDGGLLPAANLLTGIAAKSARLVNAEHGASVDASGKISLPAPLQQALSTLRQQGYVPHIVVGQRQPAQFSKPASEWNGGDWKAYQDYATRFVRGIALQFEQAGFPEVLFEVGNEIATTADPLELWSLANPSVAPGDDTRYQHYMRVYQAWSRAVERVTKDDRSRIIQVAGPGMGGHSLYLTTSFWHERFIRDVAAGGLRLDAVTHHFYGDIFNGWANAPESGLKSQLQRIRRALQAAGRNIPIVVSEYGPSESSDGLLGRINYSHEGAAWAAAFIGEAIGGTAVIGSYALLRDNFGSQTTGVPGIASLSHAYSGADYPKPVYNTMRMYTLLPGSRKGVKTSDTQPDIRAFASAEGAGAGLIVSNHKFRHSDATDLSTSQAVTPGFYNLPFTGTVAVERYLVDANTSNAGRYIQAQQAPDAAGSALTRVEHCAASVDASGSLLLPARTLSSSAVSLWLVKPDAASGLPACATPVADSGTSTGGGTTGGGTTSGGTTTDGTTSGGTTSGGTTSGGTTTDGTTSGGTTTGAQDFATRCSAPGVVKCVGFDNATDISGGAGANSGIYSGASIPALDANVKASGSSSLKFTIPSNSAANTSGGYWTNFSPDLSVQFGENSEFFVQWRQRFSPEFISTNYLGSGGIKQAIITTGDKPIKLYASCEAIGVVLQTYYLNRFPILYNSCTGSTSHGPYDGFYESIPGDFKLQNARPSPYCLYSQSPNNYLPPNGNCFGWVSNEWMTFQVRIKTGPRVNDEWTNSYVTLWVAREGQPSEMVINWGPYNLTAGPTTEDQRFGKIFLLPYQTGKDSTQAHPTAYTWYDELIISRTKIADPAAGGTTTTTSPSSGTTDTTPPSAPTGLSASVASSSAINLGWSASADNVGVTGYRIYRCQGSGCTPTTAVATVNGPSFGDSGLAPTTTYGYKVVAFDAAGNASAYSSTVFATTQGSTTAGPSNPGSSPTPNPLLSTLQANTAMDLGPLVCTDAEGEYPGACRAVTGDSGMAYDSKRGQIVLFGGGHSTTNYNAVNTFSLGTLTWKEEYLPTPCSSMTFSNYDRDRGAWLSGPSGPYPRPAARHTYDQLVVAGDELIVLANVEGNAPCVETNGSYTSYELVTPAKVAHYNFATKTWSFASTTGAGNAVFPSAEFDPVSGKIVMLGGNGLEIYDPATRTKTLAIDLSRVYGVKDEQGNIVPATELVYSRNMVYYPPNQNMYYITRNAVFEVKLDRTDFTRSTITKLTTGGVTVVQPNYNSVGFAYDSVNKIIGGNVYKGVFYAFDPMTKSWTSRTVQGGLTGDQANEAIAYDPVNNVFVFITAENFLANKKIWAYRYGTGL